MPEPTEDAPTIDPAVARRVVLGMTGLIAVAAVVVLALRTPTPPPPAEIAADPLLVQGREVFLSRCASCHGEKGKGDGPIARGLTGKPVGDLTAAHWKHGDRPEEALGVIARGVPGTNMSAWGSTLGNDGVRAVTAYVFYLAGRAVPGALRAP